MSQFLPEECVGVFKTRFGPAHGWRGAGGVIFYCKRSQTSCPKCRTEGVPQVDPDPFDVTAKLLLEYGDEKWFHSNRMSIGGPARNDGELDLMAGLVIYVRVEGKTIVIADFGPVGDVYGIELIVSAICYQHNRSLGHEQ
jgi:hypothetical protein